MSISGKDDDSFMWCATVIADGLVVSLVKVTVVRFAPSLLPTSFSSLFLFNQA